MQRFYSWCLLHRDSAEILRFAAEICLLMSTTNHFISLSHGETVNENWLSGYRHQIKTKHACHVSLSRECGEMVSWEFANQPSCMVIT